MRFTIGVKLALTFGLVILLSVINALIGVNGVQTVVRTYEEEALRVAETAFLTETFEKQVIAQGQNVSTFQLIGTDVYFERFNTAVDLALEAADTLKRTMRSEYALGLVDEMIELQTQYAAGILPMLDGSVVAGTPEHAETTAKVTPIRASLGEVLEELLEYQQFRLVETRQAADEAGRRAQSVMFFVAIAVTLIGIAIAFTLTRSISGPVRQVAQAAQRLADGDLTIEELDVSSRDEIGGMATAFNRMVANLRGIMGQVRETSRTLLNNGEHLLAAAEESTGATAQIAAAVNEVAQGTANQVSQVDETRKAMEQLRQAIDQIAAGAQEQAQRAEQTGRSLEQMTLSIDHVSGSAREVADASGQGADRAKAQVGPTKGSKLLSKLLQGWNKSARPSFG